MSDHLPPMLQQQWQLYCLFKAKQFVDDDNFGLISPEAEWCSEEWTDIWLVAAVRRMRTHDGGDGYDRYVPVGPRHMLLLLLLLVMVLN